MQEGPLVEINNSEELEAWLQKQPREVAVAFAARMALRVLPFVQTARDPGFEGDFLAGIVLPVFRATGVAWAAAKYPDQATKFRAAAAYAATIFAATTATALAADAAAFAAFAAAAAADRAAASAADRASTADRAFAVDPRAFWSAVSIDATHVEDGAAASVIAGSPLWPQRQHIVLGLTSRSPMLLFEPKELNGQPDELQSLWQEMKAALLAAGQDWEVWTDWYDDRLAGRVRDEERELAYVWIEEALWNQGPAIVNAEIKKRLAEDRSAALTVTEAPDEAAFTGTVAWTVPLAAASTAISSARSSLNVEPTPPIEAIPEQEPIATRFGVNSQGLIDVVPDPPTPRTAADPLQREYYEETRLKAQALAELGPNLLGELSDPAKRFHEGLKGRIEEISITSIWSRGNTLRRLLKAHDRSPDNAEPDPGRLPPLVAETLGDLVDTWNIFIVGDPKGRELDEIRLGPQDVEAAKQVVAAAVPLVEALQHSENIATQSAIEAVAEQAEAAKTAPARIGGDQDINLSRKTTGNFVSELLRRIIGGESAFAWKEFRAGIYRAAGTATAAGAGGIGYAAYNNWPAIVSFVARNADVLKEFVTAQWHNPTLVEIIDWVVRTLT